MVSPGGGGVAPQVHLKKHTWLSLAKRPLDLVGLKAFEVPSGGYGPSLSLLH